MGNNLGMIYPAIAVGQFFVILLSAIAKAAGLIAAGTALAICVAASIVVAIHALIIHHRTGHWRNRAESPQKTCPS